MSTTVDLTIGLNLEIGSVPVSLSAEVTTSADQTVYTFDGCVQDAVIDIGTFLSYVGQQFGVDVQLPPELNLQAQIDYVAGQIIYTKPAGGNATTELGVSAQFVLQYSNGGSPQSVTFNFYADTIITSGTDSPAYVFGASIATDLQFKNLPLVGDIPVFNQYTLKNLGFSYTKSSAAEPVTFNIPQVNTTTNPLYTRSDPNAKNKNNYSISTQGDQTTFSLAQKGFSFTAGLMKEGSADATGNFSLPMALPAAAAGPGPAQFASGTSSPPASPVHWINVNKTFGPVDLQKIGVNYKDGEATFGLSAGFSLGAFSLDLQGLTITFPLPLPGMPAGNSVSFDLDGLGMTFQRGNLNIGGAFLKNTSSGITNYYGEVVVQVGNFGFTALGGYAPAQNNRPASFFLYANLQVPLGGPPFLYVTGLAFGFGINNTLILPTIDTLPGYLLLPNNAPAQTGSPSSTISTVMPQMASIFQNQPGQYWVAAGIQFTSFEMITAFALLTVSFGVEMQIGILGTCAITLPKGDPSPLAYIEIDMVASFTPSSGLLQVLGVVSPASFVWGGFVKLSGGFAFCIWFSGEHKGDFVVTIGGYNPAYTSKPAWYPNVPRLGMSFGLGPFQAQGTAYLALTPSMFMAGMQFTATWSAGPVSAWFSAGVDFLVTWAPFTYQANAYVNVGCSVDLGLFTVHAHIGANLNVWGPSFGGEAHVDLDVCSFTIHFGSSEPVAAPISWQNLEQNFLPPPPPSSLKAQGPHAMMVGAAQTATPPAQTTANVSASASIGTLATNVSSPDGEVWNWVLDPNNFVIVTATSIPTTNAIWMTGATVPTPIPNNTASYNQQTVNVTTLPYLVFTPGSNPCPAPFVWNTNIHVKPMNLSNAQSTHTIRLCKHNTGDQIGTFNDYLTMFTVNPILQGSNTALWGDPTLNADATNPELIPNTLLGFTITPLPRHPLTVNNVPLITLLYTQDNNVQFTWSSSQPSTAYTVTSSTDTSQNLVINITGQPTQTLTNAGYILSSLIDSQVTGRRNSILTDLTTHGFSTLAPAAVDLQAMGTTEMLTDWPTIGILGGTINS